MKNYVEQRASLIAAHERELQKLEVEERVANALDEAGAPEARYICVHSNHASAKLEPDANAVASKFSPQQAVEVARLFAPYIVAMDPASDGLCRSIWPAEIPETPQKWISEGVPMSWDLRQHAFGEMARSSLPQYQEASLSFWVRLSCHLIHIELPLSMVPQSSRVWYDSHGNRRMPDHVPGSRVIRFAPGGRVGGDVHHLFQSIDDLAAALGVPAEEEA